MPATLKNISAMLIFGSIGLFVRYIDLASSQIALVRGFIGAAVLLFAMSVLKKSLDFSAWRKNALILLISGGAIGFNWIFLFQAYHYTTIAVATLTYYLAPTIVVLVSPFFLHESFTRRKLICVILALIGMMLIADIFAGLSSGVGSMQGVIYGICAAAFYASVIISNKFLHDISAMDSTIAQLIIATLILLPYVVCQDNSWSADIASLLLLLTVGAIHTGFAYLLYFSSLQKLSAPTVALFSYIDPVTAILLSTFLLAEPMSPVQWLGAILILGSLFISQFPAGKS